MIDQNAGYNREGEYGKISEKSPYQLYEEKYPELVKFMQGTDWNPEIALRKALLEKFDDKLSVLMVEGELKMIVEDDPRRNKPPFDDDVGKFSSMPLSFSRPTAVPGWEFKKMTLKEITETYSFRDIRKTKFYTVYKSQIEEILKNENSSTDSQL